MIKLAGRQASGVSVAADYERVYDGISGKIRARAPGYQPGQRIPTIVALAAEYDTGQTTVKLALTLLERDGWTHGRQGKGTFVADNPPNVVPETP